VRFRQPADDLVGPDLSQPFQGERRAGTVTQQPFQPGAIVAGNPHRGVE
jgi:hypothetical protein